MVNVTLVDRKSNALTPSSLRCLSHLPTINMTVGCVHGCTYCYIRGYSQYPGDDAVVVYRNTAEQVERELHRKRKQPIAVYFCPSSDAFMPIEPVLDQSYRTMKLLLDHDIGVQFVTKGAIPDRFFDLFAQRPQLVAGQIGLTTLDDPLNAAIEPQAAPAQRRLDDLRRLVEIGVTASFRADPLIHGVTDDDAHLNALFAKAASHGIRDVSASYLFLRPGIIGSLKRNIRDAQLLRCILAPYETARRSSIRGGASTGLSLPVEQRRRELERVRRLAGHHGLALRICGCKNAELTNTRCHLTNLTATARSPQRDSQQAQLW
ncbi:radical SAM protein [Planctomycetales bacterium ZRK34]|nr:radical SAM protein [Planctomycetales bacterium ZRK34]